MPLYTMNLCKADGMPVSFEILDLPTDSEAFIRAGDMLDLDVNCDHVDVWEDDRPVVGRHRLQPIIRKL